MQESQNDVSEKEFHVNHISFQPSCGGGAANGAGAANGGAGDAANGGGDAKGGACVAPKIPGNQVTTRSSYWI